MAQEGASTTAHTRPTSRLVGPSPTESHLYSQSRRAERGDSMGRAAPGERVREGGMGAGTGRGLGGSPTRGQRLSGGVDGMGRYSESMASKGRGEGGQERGMLNGSSSYAHNEVANGRSNDESSHGTDNWWEDDMPHPHEASAGGDEQRNRLGQQQAYYPSTSSVSPAPPLLPLDHRFSPNPSYRTLNANGANTASLSNYPSSGSSSSPSLLLSPLSPFVEPFSPTMTGAMNGLSIGGSTWGLGLAKGSSQGSSHELSPTTPTTDLRSMYSAQAQQFHLEQQSQQQPALFPFSSARSLPPHSPTSATSNHFPYPPTYSSQLASLNTAITPLPFDLYADSRGGSEVDTLSPRLGGYGRGGGFSEIVGGNRGIVGMGIGLVNTNPTPMTGPTSATGSSADVPEEISTIFVVGFPDDMNEREFQNMFVFSKGFEAASLKVPVGTSTSREREYTAGVGASTTSVEAGGPHEDTFGHPPLDGPASSIPQSFSATSLSTTRDLAGSPLSSSSRKQIIGFAKFRTRAQALEARDVLTGRRVDADKGNVLKAEMAKKNLHTKRGLSNELGGGTSFPLSALDTGTLARLAGGGGLVNPVVLAEMARQTVAAQGGGATERAAFDAFHSVPPTSYAGSSSREYYEEPTSPTTTAASPFYKLRQDPRSSFTPTSSTDFAPSHDLPPPSSNTIQTSPHVRNTTLSNAYIGNSMLQQLDSSHPSDLQSPTSPYDSSRIPRSSTSSVYPFNSPPPFPSGPYSLDAGGTYHPTLYQGFSPPGTTVMGRMGGAAVQPSMGLNGIPRTQNPADMNAPKNTLYVGGLPAVLPSLTGPFSAAYLEDSLRNVFSRCTGFRRLCFRSKSNGPIVFVEFTDVGCATRAMTEMYGNTLGGIVKGGIRLSYSKNPLGVRTGSIPNGSSGPLSPVQGASTDETFLFNNYATTNPPLRRPSESVFGPAPLSTTFRPPPPPQLRSPTNFTPTNQFASSFSPFGTTYES